MKTKSDILQEIIAHKKRELASIDLDINSFYALKNFNRQPLSLTQELSKNKPHIIAELKKKSPSSGWINQHADITAIAQSYNNGAAAISVLTDEYFFGGNIDILETVREYSSIPILRKDFMIHPYQIAEAKAKGADVILLIAACLSVQETINLTSCAHDHGLEVLLEIHDTTHLNHIHPNVDIIGINNRNLKTFEVNVDNSIELMRHLPSDKPLIAESGIEDLATIKQLFEHGFSGFLIGSHFMRQENPAIYFQQFITELNHQYEN